MTNARIFSRRRRWSPTGVASALVLAVLTAGLLLVAGPARADGATDYSSALKDIASSSTDAVVQAITALGATEDPRALKFLQSLDGGDVAVDAAGGVFVRDSGGCLARRRHGGCR